MNENDLYDSEIVCVQPKQKPKNRIAPWLISLAVTLPICIVTIALCAFLVLGTEIFGKDKEHGIEGPMPYTGITISPGDVGTDKAVEALKSVVNIKNVGGLGGFFGQSLSLGNGTGVIVREDGYILTSASVVESVGAVTVTMQDGTEYEAEVHNVDNQNNAAVLKINVAGLTPIAIGDSSAVAVGDAVSVIGNAISDNLSNPITVGTVSGVDNSVALQGGRNVNIFQIDASAIAESVGGLVLNAKGELIAITTAMISNPSSEIGIATPINDLKGALNNIVSVEGNDNGLTIGISGTDAEYGVVLEMIAEGSPAEKAGLKTGDLVLKVAGEAVSSINDISEIKNRHKKGDTLVFSVYRDGEMLEINVIL